MKRLPSAFERRYAGFKTALLQAMIPVHSIFAQQIGERPLVRISITGSQHYQRIMRLAEECFGKNGFVLHVEKDFAQLSSTISVGEGIRHASAMGWGTLGGIFTRPNDPDVYALSNNHVIANFNHANQGDFIFHTAYGQIGSLYNWFTLVEFPNTNYIDAALVRLNREFLAQWNAPSPSNGNWMDAFVGMEVVKRGFATGVTYGTVSHVNGHGNAGFSGRVYHFSGIIEIQGINGPFSAIGDSGSVVMTWPGQVMVGLLFATSGDRGWALPISRIQGLLS